MAVLTILRRLLIIAALAAAVTAAVRARRSQPEASPTWPPLEAAGFSDAPSPTASATTPAVAPWVEPNDGDCPTSHPIKTKTTSGIYHQPGGRSYDRTRADRCYCDTDAAETDGFRPARA
jgi:type II secretory pathway pseudopilin PulG